MTKPLFLLTFIVMAAAGCHRALGPYRNMDKWILLGGDDRRPLSGHPREITEYSYAAPDTAHPEKRRIIYIKYGFNADGDIVSRDTYMVDTLVMRMKTSYNSNGLQITTTNVKSGQTNDVISRPLADGRFETISFHQKSKPTASVSSFPAVGQELIRDDYDDTAINVKAPRSVHIYYNGNRIAKITGYSEAGKFEERLFYSRWDTPDSAQVFGGSLVGHRLLERRLYMINDHGDPTRYITIRGKDTLVIEAYRYVYDQQGNWTRQITTSLKNGEPGSQYYPMNQASVTDREIQY